MSALKNDTDGDDTGDGDEEKEKEVFKRFPSQW